MALAEVVMRLQVATKLSCKVNCCPASSCSVPIVEARQCSVRMRDAAQVKYASAAQMAGLTTVATCLGRDKENGFSSCRRDLATGVTRVESTPLLGPGTYWVHRPGTTNVTDD